VNYYIGVMSGTSLDGIDVAITTLEPSGEFQFIAAQTLPFPEQLHQKLQLLITDQYCNLQDFGEIDIALGQLIGKSINQLLNTHQLSAKDIKAIGSHGQTLFHSPSGELPFSLQIGDASVIAEITGITTVADFRQRDIAAGGQGAPLVPAFHQAVFSNENEERVIVNIGGISNITLLPASSNENVIGFDTGPGNVLLDYWAKLHLGKTYDENGQWAKSGQCNKDLLSVFLNEAYFKQVIPKSTGRELFNKAWLDNKLAGYAKELDPADVQTTLVELTALTIAEDIEAYTTSNCNVFICGGGAHNSYLLDRIQSLVNNKKVSTTDDLGLHPDWVEACAFAWLAYRTVNQQVGNLTAVTGAKHPVILGAIHPA